MDSCALTNSSIVRNDYELLSNVSMDNNKSVSHVAKLINSRTEILSKLHVSRLKELCLAVQKEILWMESRKQ